MARFYNPVHPIILKIIVQTNCFGPQSFLRITLRREEESGSCFQDHFKWLTDPATGAGRQPFIV